MAQATTTDAPLEEIGLLEATVHVRKGYWPDQPMLVLVGSIPFMEACPGQFAAETSEDDWWYDGLAYETLGTYKGEKVYVLEPTWWRPHDDDGLEMGWALETYEGHLLTETFEFYVGGDALTKAILFAQDPERPLKDESFPHEKFIVCNFF